jgi:hypothetical protein
MARGKDKRKRKKLLAKATDPTQITHIGVDDLPFSLWEEEVAANGMLLAEASSWGKKKKIKIIYARYGKALQAGWWDN